MAREWWSRAKNKSGTWRDDKQPVQQQRQQQQQK
jgi:hypothetical protein